MNMVWFENIDAIKATLTEEEFIGFCKGNALKYQFRAGKKGQAKTEEQEVTPEQKVPTTAKAPEGYKLNPLYVENKTKRLQLVLQPSLFNRVKKGAKQAGLSVNEYVHRILDEATKRRGVLKYDGDNQTEKLVINKGDYIVLKSDELYCCNPNDFENFYISADEV